MKRAFNVFLNYAVMVFLILLALILEIASQRARKERPSDEEMERRLAIGMRAADRRGWIER